MATIFDFLYMGYTMASPGEYDWAARVRRRCGLSLCQIIPACGFVL